MKHKLIRVVTRGGIITLQVVFIWLLCLLGNEIQYLLHLPLPGSLLALGGLLLLLHLHVIPMRFVQQGANFLIAQLLLFFVPSAVGVLQLGNMLRTDGWRIALVIAASTVLVMIVTGLVAEWSMRAREIRDSA